MSQAVDLIPRVFVSYTARDLARHADVVANVLRSLQYIAIDHRDSGATGEPSVAWCLDQIDACDILVVLLAHRYGWVPGPEEQGDGETCITWLEVKHARARNKIVLPYLLEEDAVWPTKDIEGLANPTVLPRIAAFRADLSRSIAGHFTTPNSLDGPLSRDLPKAVERLKKARRAEVNQGPQATNRGRRAPVVPWLYDPNDPPTVAERMQPGLPKRVLSIDSVDADAAVVLGYLRRMELLLRVRYGDARFTLSDYFDLIAGGGFGAAIAALLARGEAVDAVESALRTILGKAYEKGAWFISTLSYRYQSEPLRAALHDVFAGLNLASHRLRTGLALIGTQLEIGRPSHFTNHPNAPELSDYGQVPLEEILLGCASNLTYHAPVLITDAQARSIALCSGSVSGVCNPALYLLILTTNPKFAFGWRLGSHRYLLMSLGGLRRARVRKPEEVVRAMIPEQINLLANASFNGPFESASLLLDALARVGLFSEDSGLDTDAALAFQRFEPDHSGSRLKALGLVDLNAHLADTASRESVRQWDDLARIGACFANLQMPVDLFRPEFDVRMPTG